MKKQSQLLLQPTEVELGLQIGVEFDNKRQNLIIEGDMAPFRFTKLSQAQPQRPESFSTSFYLKTNKEVVFPPLLVEVNQAIMSLFIESKLHIFFSILQE